MLRDVKIDLQYQPLISGPPESAGDLFKRACTGDKVTIDHWRDTWLENYKAAKDRFGNFGEKSFGNLFGLNKHKPAVVIGSGPSLRNAIKDLKENAEAKTPVMTLSCLHNFGYFEDEGFHADYYLSLDSGGVVIEDVEEGRNKDGGFYWEQTKGKKLLAYVASDPKLFDLWQGDIYLFNSLVPNAGMRQEFNKVERFAHYVSSGGNALGACMYTAKAVMGSSDIIYVGADFCFDYDNTFHAYKTQYDDYSGKGVGKVVRAVDVYGVPRSTWPSYMNFKFWFDHIACTIPGAWVNCSEGLMGAYREGNICQFQYKTLHSALLPYKGADSLFLDEKDSEGKVLSRKAMSLQELFSNPAYEHDLTLF